MNNDSDEKKPEAIVVRLLNGMLRGCEFSLAEPTLFVVSQDKDLGNQAVSTVLPDNAIFIPASTDKWNFEIIPPTADETHARIRELADSGLIEHEAGWQQVKKIGDVCFAVRRQEDSWHKDILDYPVQEPRDLTSSHQYGRYYWLSGLLVAALIAAITAGTYYFYSPTRQTAEISSAIGDNMGNYTILSGRDNTRYVLVNDEDAISWVRQALIKTPTFANVRVINNHEEENKVSRWIKDEYPQVKLHRVNFMNPYRPELVLSEERGHLDSKRAGILREKLLQRVPWAKDIVFSFISDTVVAAAAEHGLIKSSQYFSTNKTDDNITYLIRGELNDAQLESLKHLIREFYQVWGDNYVTFSVELQNDWLKDKSFKYGDNGYIKLKPGYWFFSQPMYKETIKYE